MSSFVYRDGVCYRKMPNGGLLKHREAAVCDFGPFPRCSGVYMIKCLKSDKKYIGSTGNLNTRLSGHCNRIKKGSVRGLASNFDFNNVEFIVLESGNLSKEALLVLESHYIEKFDCKYPAGFNKKDPFTGVYFPSVFDYIYKKAHRD